MKKIIILIALIFLSVLLYAQDTMWLYKEGVMYEAVPRMKNIPVGKEGDEKIQALYKNATAFSDTEYVWGIKPFPIGYFVVDRFQKVTTYAKGVDENGVYVSPSVQKKLINEFYPNWFYLAVFLVWIFVITIIPKLKSISPSSFLLFMVVMPGTFVFIIWVLWEMAPSKDMDFWIYAVPNLLFFFLLLYRLIKKNRKLKKE